jgi:hypothetical protein
MRFDSAKSYDEVVAALLADIGDTPVPINGFPAESETWADYQAKVEPVWGPAASCCSRRSTTADGCRPRE